MKIQILLFVSLYLFGSSFSLASTLLCPKMAGSFTCLVEKNGAVITWPMVVVQSTNDEFTKHEFYHYNDGPDNAPLLLVQKASDEGQVNPNPFNPNLQYISKCAGDRINNYNLGRENPGGGDRLNERGDWITFSYGKDGTERIQVTCQRNP